MFHIYMRNSNNAFHLAIPCKDLKEAKEFYEEKLGCESRRIYDDRVTFNFFGDQLVCHLSPNKVDLNADPYPRHFGITFCDEAEFDSFVSHHCSHSILCFHSPSAYQI